MGAKTKFSTGTNFLIDLVAIRRLGQNDGAWETATIEIAWTLVVRSSRYSGLRRVVLAWVLAHEARRLQTNASTISVYLQKNALSLILDTWMALSEPRRAYADTIHTAMTVLQQAIDRHQVDPYDPKLLRQIRELGVTHQDELLRRGIIHQLVEQFSKAQTSEWASDIARTLQWFATNKARLAILRSYAAGSPLRWSFIPRKKDVENLAITAKLLGWNEKNGKQDVVLSAA